MKIADLDYSAVLSLNNSVSFDCSLMGGLSFSRLFWSFTQVDGLESYGLRLAPDGLYSFSDQTLYSDDETYQIGDLDISEVSVSTNGGLTSRSVAGSGSFGGGNFSFAASSTSASL